MYVGAADAFGKYARKGIHFPLPRIVIHHADLACACADYRARGRTARTSPVAIRVGKMVEIVTARRKLKISLA